MATSYQEHRFFKIVLYSLTGIVFVTFPMHAWINNEQLPPMRPFLHVHAVVYGAWFFLVSLQASLISNKNLRLHRKLGLTSLLLAPMIIASGVLVGYENSIRRSSPDLLVSSSINVTIFALLYALALLKRRQTEWHIRMIVFASLSIMLPAFARVGYVFNFPPFWVLLPWIAYIASVLIYDKRTLKKITNASKLGLAISISHFLLLVVFASGGE